MTNLAEGFMLISEQEKSGKVERRKDMQTMTSAYANKMLKSLEEDRKSTRLNSSHPTTSRMPSSA